MKTLNFACHYTDAVVGTNQFMISAGIGNEKTIRNGMDYGKNVKKIIDHLVNEHIKRWNL